MKKKLLAALLSTAMVVGCLAGCGEKPVESNTTPSSSKEEQSSENNATEEDNNEVADQMTNEERLLQPYDEPVDIHVVLQYRESENPDTPQDVTPQTSTAVKLFKERLNINLIYDWIVNADQFQQKFGAELAAGNIPDIVMVSPNDFEDLQGQGAFRDLSEAYDLYGCEKLDTVFNYDGNFINVGMRDGKLLGLPMGTDPAQMTSQMLYNMTQLKAVGIESEDQLPKTIEEFEALCDKLMETDWDGDGKTGGPVLPACKNYFGAQLGDFTPFFHAYETWTEGWYDNNGTLEYAGINPALKDTLTKLNEWYNKGYFVKDFAAYDIWAADSPVVSDIVGGKYPIVPGSWWVPNWPLNSNKVEHPDSQWVIGPNLSLDGQQPTIMIDRYPVNNFVAVGKDCEHPEAVFKMMYMSMVYSDEGNAPEKVNNMSEEEKIERASYVYTWLPYRVYSPITLRTNFKTINELLNQGVTEPTAEQAAKNDEFWSAWNGAQKYLENPDDGVAWGSFFSRIDPNGGVAHMIDVVETADIIYDEVYVTTPSMISRQGELDKFRDNTFLSMIMGETPISDFDKYVEQWKAQGGADITKEVNDWYQNK